MYLNNLSAVSPFIYKVNKKHPTKPNQTKQQPQPQKQVSQPQPTEAAQSTSVKRSSFYYLMTIREGRKLEFIFLKLILENLRRLYGESRLAHFWWCILLLYAQYPNRNYKICFVILPVINVPKTNLCWHPPSTRKHYVFRRNVTG